LLDFAAAERRAAAKGQVWTSRLRREAFRRRVGRVVCEERSAGNAEKTVKDEDVEGMSYDDALKAHYEGMLRRHGLLPGQKQTSGTAGSDGSTNGNTLGKAKTPLPYDAVHDHNPFAALFMTGNNSSRGAGNLRASGSASRPNSVAQVAKAAAAERAAGWQAATELARRYAAEMGLNSGDNAGENSGGATEIDGADDSFELLLGCLRVTIGQFLPEFPFALAALDDASCASAVRLATGQPAQHAVVTRLLSEVGANWDVAQRLRVPSWSGLGCSTASAEEEGHGELISFSQHSDASAGNVGVRAFSKKLAELAAVIAAAKLREARAMSAKAGDHEFWHSLGSSGPSSGSTGPGRASSLGVSSSEQAAMDKLAFLCGGDDSSSRFSQMPSPYGGGAVLSSAQEGFQKELQRTRDEAVFWAVVSGKTAQYIKALLASKLFANQGGPADAVAGNAGSAGGGQSPGSSYSGSFFATSAARDRGNFSGGETGTRAGGIGAVGWSSPGDRGGTDEFALSASSSPSRREADPFGFGFSSSSSENHPELPSDAACSAAGLLALLQLEHVWGPGSGAAAARRGAGVAMHDSRRVDAWDDDDDAARLRWRIRANQVVAERNIFALVQRGRHHLAAALALMLGDQTSRLAAQASQASPAGNLDGECGGGTGSLLGRSPSSAHGPSGPGGSGGLVEAGGGALVSASGDDPGLRTAAGYFQDAEDIVNRRLGSRELVLLLRIVRGARGPAS